MLREGIVDRHDLHVVAQKSEPFTDKQIELVTTFADQAVIAIENVRLFDEVQARTEDLAEVAAAADRHRRRAQGHQPLDVRSAGGARHAGRIGGSAMRGGQRDHSPAGRRRLSVSSQATASRSEYAKYMRAHPIEPGRGTVLGRAVSGGRPVHVSDVTADPEYTLTEAAEARRIPHHARRPADARGYSDRRDYADSLRRAALHRQTDRTGSRPSPTRR